jgi:predicted RNA-binding protein YlqC (UPF0109 family)
LCSPAAFLGEGVTHVRYVSFDGRSRKLKPLIEYLVRALVDEPGEVSITEIPGDESTTYEVHVAPNDLGKVIGKQGRIANALRTVAKAVAMKEKRKVYLEIIA